MRDFTQAEVNAMALSCANQLLADPTIVSRRLYGIPRGGVPAAYAVARFLPDAEVVDDPSDATIFVDDLLDSGSTLERYREYTAVWCVLFSKKLPSPYVIAGANGVPTEWVRFPWERASEHSSADDIPRRLLQYIGENPDREGLHETPIRFLKAWDTWASGYRQDPAQILKVFEDGAESYDEMVLVKDIPVYSHCEHHLAPFFGVAHVGYIPNGRIVGLSKLSRLVDVFSRRLQVQERLTRQIADELQKNLKPLGVGVVLECRHLCMESRGIQRQGATTTTSAMLGVLHDEASARSEFLTLIRSK